MKEELSDIMDHFLEVQDAYFYETEVLALHVCWLKFVNVGGDFLKYKFANFSEIDAFNHMLQTYQSFL